MELTSKTIDILKNYSQINPNIVIKSGNELKTISVARNVLSSATVDVNFPIEFGIYDLSEFLGVVSLVDSPNLKFENKYVVISDSSGRSSIKYFYSDPEMLTAPSKDIIMPNSEVTFALDTNTLSRLKRATATLGHDEISITPSNGVVQLSVVDSKDKTSNTFTIDVEGNYEEGADFNFILNVNNLKVIAEDFDVSISSKLISHFKSLQSELEYFIALEKTSTYGA